MTQSELVQYLAQELEWSQTETRDTLKRLVAEWTDRLDRGEAFTVPGLGTFRTELQDTRTRYSPHHDRKLLLPPQVQVRFSPSQSLKDALNRNENMESE